MRDFLRVLAYVVLLGVSILLLVANIVWHLQHPDATDMRLFLMFWKEYVGMILAILISVIVAMVTER